MLRYSAFNANKERNCYFTAPVRNGTTHCQALQNFPDIIQVPRYKHNKINLRY
jgi:hypothetical protein